MGDSEKGNTNGTHSFNTYLNSLNNVILYHRYSLKYFFKKFI